MRTKLIATALALFLLLVAIPASAVFHLMKVVEIFPGATVAPNAQYIVIQMYTGGADNVLGTNDDQRVTTQLNYQSTGNRIIIRSTVPADTGYRVKLVSNRIGTPDDDVSLDGEFSGTFPSGNGSQFPAGVKDGNELFHGEAVANVPLIADRLGARAVVWGDSGGGYIDQRSSAGFAEDVNDQSIWGGRLILASQLTGALKVTATGLYQESEADGSQYFEFGRPDYQNISPTLEPFEDERVQERLVEAVRAPKMEAARAEFMAELRERYPASPP